MAPVAERLSLDSAAMKKDTQPTWTTIRKQLKSWDSEALLSLIK